MSNDALANKSGAGRLAGRSGCGGGCGGNRPTLALVMQWVTAGQPYFFARGRARVLAVDRDPDALRETDLIVQAGGSVLLAVADITDEEQVGKTSASRRGQPLAVSIFCTTMWDRHG